MVGIEVFINVALSTGHSAVLEYKHDHPKPWEGPNLFRISTLTRHAGALSMYFTSETLGKDFPFQPLANPVMPWDTHKLGVLAAYQYLDRWFIFA